MTDFTIDLDRIADAMRDRFAGRLQTLFTPALGTLPALSTEAEVRQHFTLLMHHAATEGFGRRNLTVKYAFVATHLGMFFAHNPLLDGMREAALWQHGSVHGIVGLNRMFDHADLMIAEGLINRNTGFVPGLIEACALPDDMPALDVVARAAPKRARAFGEATLHRAFAAAKDQCAQGAALSDCRPRDAAIACHFLGHGFWRDPLYHWVPGVLAQNGLTGLGERLNG